MSLCSHCRITIRKAIRHSFQLQSSRASLSTKTSTTSKILAQPTWSIRSLVAAPEDGKKVEKISPTQLHHLLRLSALPLPKSKAEEDSMIATLQSQLQFVRAIQEVDTTGVEPLRAIRDETEAGIKERTISLDDLKAALAKEAQVGHYKRPKRVKEKIESEAENWNALSTASRTAGKYFVVDAKKAQET